VIICPGGGYRWLAVEAEGAPIAAWFNARGVTAFVLKYRVGEYPHPAPLRDVLRAIRMVRSQATEFGVKADRIGVIGFSAGGHLASSAATLFDAPEGKTGAALDAVSARPDFVMLIYPVITMKDPFTHKGSRSALLGNTPKPELIERLSTDQQVSKETPPTFLVHGNDDKWVPPENSFGFYEALRRSGVPAELHIFEHGPHGMAMNPGIVAATEWPKMLESWLSLHGWINSARAPLATKDGL
jgi:acetyl esterase/lipase